jgi:hypothetical protein
MDPTFPVRRLDPTNNCVQDWETQRKLAYKQIDKGGFGYWTVFVAGAGFLTDAYDVSATPQCTRLCPSRTHIDFFTLDIRRQHGATDVGSRVLEWPNSSE